ncbi:MAG TPA: hypothetical protein DDZ41_03950 [Flavobacterium sp.]|nr:hypothetical protein [Flavobacterium sp.]
MFDGVSLEVRNFTHENFNQFLENIGQINNCNYSRGRKIVFWSNLRVYYFSNENVLRIQNSLHKFYNSEINNFGLYNHDDFTYSKVEITINYIENKLNVSSNEIYLKGKFEYGLNIQTFKYNPFKDIIDRFQSIVTTATNPFYVLYNENGKPFLKFCSFNQYKIKIYDKGKQMELQSRSKIMRYEIVNHNSIKTKKVFNKSIITLNDLLDKEIWNRCFYQLLKSYNNIRVLPFPDEVSIGDYSKCLLYSSLIFKNDYYKVYKKNYKDLKLVHNSIKNNESGVYFLIRQKLEDNYRQLLLN